MHVNGLVNTCQDNPQRLDKPKLVSLVKFKYTVDLFVFVQVKHIMDFLETDTILFHSLEPPELLKLQADKWNPVLLWFRQRWIISIKRLVRHQFYSLNDFSCLSEVNPNTMNRSVRTFVFRAELGIFKRSQMRVTPSGTT